MWEQGQHLALIGPTGTGKTTMAERLLSSRRYVIVLRVKSDTLAWRSFRMIHRASEMDTAKPNRDGSIRLLLHPGEADRAEQFRLAMRKAFNQGGWTVYFDELYEMQLLGLEPESIRLYSEGRSERVTVVGGMQRPSWIGRGLARWAISQPVHRIVFQPGDDVDARTLRDLLGRDFVADMEGLRRFQALYRNQITGRTQVVTRDSILGVM
jgi:hypothetical protein